MADGELGAIVAGFLHVREAEKDPSCRVLACMDDAEGKTI
jgi:hypothetical protein